MVAQLMSEMIPGIELILLTLLVLLAVFAALGNSLSMYIFGRMIKNKHRQSTATITRLVFLNLALTDLINGFICIPFSAVLIAQDRNLDMKNTSTKVLCSSIGILFNIVSRTSIFLIAVVSVDRFVALFYPNFYRSHVRQAISMVRFYVAASWVISIILSALPYFRGKGYIYFYRQLRCSYDLMEDLDSPHMKITSFTAVQIIPTFLPFLVMTVTSTLVYVRIVKSIDKRRKQLATNIDKAKIVKLSETCSTQPLIWCPPAKHRLDEGPCNDHELAEVKTSAPNGRHDRAHRISFIVAEPQEFNEIRPVARSNGDKTILNQQNSDGNIFSTYCEESIETGSLGYDDMTHGSDSEISNIRRNSHCLRRISSGQFEIPHHSCTSPDKTQPGLLSVGKQLLHSESTPAMNADGEKLSHTAPNSRRCSRRESGVISPSPSLGGGLSLPRTQARRLSVSVIACTSQQSLTAPDTPMKKKSTAKSLKSLVNKATISVSRLRHKECKVLERRKKGAMTVLLMVVLFIFCYLSWFIIFSWVLLGFIDKPLRMRRHLNDVQLLYLFTLFPVGAFANSGINPLVYYTRNFAFKKEVSLAWTEFRRWICDVFGRLAYQRVQRR